MKNTAIFIYLVIISLIKLYQSYIVLPFKFRSPPKISDLSKLVNDLIENNLIISLPFGEPKKLIDFYASMNLYLYYLEEGSCLSDTNPIYYFDNSKSFSFNKNISFCNVKLDKCALGTEKIYFYQDINLISTVELPNFLFYYGYQINNINKKNKQICGKIGFQLENLPYHYYEYENFIRMMKKKELITSYSWYIHYYQKPFGKELYDGAIILDIFNTKFFNDFSYLKNDNDYNSINVKDLEAILAWTFKFDKIYYSTNDTKIEINNKEVGLAFEKKFVFCPEGYFESIKIKFFDYYFQNNICFLKEGKYNFIYCDKNKFINDINNFPILYFKSNTLNKLFTLDGNDLFKEYNNYFIFMILLKEYSYKFWTLGNIFMRKYNFYFDSDRKFIGCFEKIEKNNNDKGFIEFFNKIKWYLFITFGIIIGFLIGKKLRDNVRKLRANELQDNYEYLENKANINKDNIVVEKNNNISNCKEIKSQLYDISQENK